MPVKTTKYYIRLYHPAEANLTAGRRLLYKIMQFLTSPPNERTEKHFILICKAVLYSYNRETKDLSEEVLRRFFNKNGYPISLTSETTQMNHKRWDGVEKLIIVCDGPGDDKKAVAFEKFEGGRRIRYGYVR